ncbi:MAG: DUF1761 domain-containing protein [Spartobacteria bacterium]
MNWLAILSAGAAYWVLGYVWYSFLFGRIAAAEEGRDVNATRTGGEMGAQLVGTFVANVIAAGAMAYLIKRTGITDMNHALKLAAATGIGFAGTAITMSSIWEGKTTKNWMVDAGYYFAGAILLAMILISWR